MGDVVGDGGYFGIMKRVKLELWYAVGAYIRVGGE